MTIKEKIKKGFKIGKDIQTDFLSGNTGKKKGEKKRPAGERKVTRIC